MVSGIDLRDGNDSVIKFHGNSGQSSKLKAEGSRLKGCSPIEDPFEGASRGFLLTNLGEVEGRRCQLFDPPQAESFDIAWSKP
jgi:hypothetical protein